MASTPWGCWTTPSKYSGVNSKFMATLGTLCTYLKDRDAFPTTRRPDVEAESETRTRTVLSSQGDELLDEWQPSSEGFISPVPWVVGPPSSCCTELGCRVGV